jgi:hypothetical protein
MRNKKYFQYDDLKVQAKEEIVHCISLNTKQLKMSSDSLFPTEVFRGFKNPELLENAVIKLIKFLRGGYKTKNNACSNWAYVLYKIKNNIYNWPYIL